MAPQTALARPARLELVDVPLGDLPDRLSKQFLMPVFLDLETLNAASIPLDKKLSHSGQYKTLEEGLTALAKVAGLAWRIHGEVLMFTAPDKPDAALDTYVYRLAQPTNFDALIESVVQVSTKTWAENGGVGAVRSFPPDLLVVFQTRGVHADMAAKFAATFRGVEHVELKNPKSAWPAQTRALSRPVSCDFDRKPLSEAMAALGRESKLPLTLDEKQLEESGKDLATPVTAHLRAVKLSTVLSLLLEPLELTYVPNKQGLRITTPAFAETQVLPVLYSVADLVADGTGESLMGVIKDTIEPTSWSDVGGSGAIRFQAEASAIEVSQYYDAHRKIEQLLADLRAAHGN